MKIRLLLEFTSGIVNNPITYKLIKEYDLEINILQAQISPQEEGRLILEIENEEKSKIDKGMKFLKREGVKLTTLTESIIFNNNNCMNCGVCTGVCKAGALVLNKDRELEIQQKKCVLCGLCMDICPVGALELRSKL